MIKIGTNLLSLEKKTPIEVFLETARELRLDCVDFHFRGFTSSEPAYLSNIKRTCLRYGLPIGYIGCSIGFGGDSTQRQESLDLFKSATDLALFLGSPIVRVFCGRIPEKDENGNDPWPSMIAGYQEAADYAAPKGISVGLQNHPSTGDDMLRIRRETDRENFNFIMDTGQWIGSPGGYPRDEDPRDVDFYAFMEQVMPHALYVRTKFYEIESGVEQWIDYDRILPILKAANYNGCISIVYEGQAEDRIEQVRLAAAYLRENLAGY